jgi:hypothetical protein
MSSVLTLNMYASSGAYNFESTKLLYTSDSYSTEVIVRMHSMSMTVGMVFSESNIIAYIKSILNIYYYYYWVNKEIKQNWINIINYYYYYYK